MKGNTKLRQDNIKRLFCEIRDRGPISKRELQSLTDFSWGNISSITTELEENGYIMSVGKQKSAVGRRPEEYDINVSDNLIIGIDFNRTGFSALLTDMRGRVLKSFGVEFREETVQTALDKLFLCLDGILKEYQGIRIRYIAFAMQGAVYSERVSAAAIKGIEGWRNVPLAEMTEQRFGIKTVLIHDPDCIIRTERHFGALSDPDINNAVLVRIDHGVGMSIMTERRLYSGHEGRSGELGYTADPFEGGFRRLDSFITESAVKNRYRELTEADGGIGCGEIADLARSGDGVAKTVFEEAGRALGIALSNAVNLLYPETVVLYGSFLKYSDLYLDTINGILEQGIYDARVTLTVSKLGDDAAAVGAALFASERVIEETEF